jgi:hypothetical protein
VKTAEQVEKERNFFKVSEPEVKTEVVPTKETKPKAEAKGKAEGEGAADEEVPLTYVPPVAKAEGESDEAFTVPAWMEGIPPESRADAEKTVRNLYEQAQKLKRQRGDAQAEKTKAEQERDEEKKQREALSKAPVPIVAPELALPTLRTHAELDAFVATAPKQIEERQGLINNIQMVLDGIEKDGEYKAPWGAEYSAKDLEAVQQQGWQARAELRQLQVDLKAVPDKREWLKKREPQQAKAEKRYPDLFKDGTEMNKAAEALKAEGRSIEAHPKAPLIIGDHLIMEMVRSGQYKLVKASAASAKEERTNAPKTAHGQESTAPVTRTGDDAEKAAAEDLRKRAAAGDRKAQKEIVSQFYKLPSAA